MRNTIRRKNHDFTVSTVKGNFGDGYIFETALLLDGEFQEVQYRARTVDSAIHFHDATVREVESGAHDYLI